MRFGIRSAALTLTGNPFRQATEECVRYWADALLVVEGARLVSVAAFSAKAAPETLHKYPDCVALPGFVDLHTHYSQLDIIGGYGVELLDWLERYAYPAESAFTDPEHAERVAERFLDNLLSVGTTSALVFPTVHDTSVEAIFSAAEARGMALASGKVLMDQHVPPELAESAENSRASVEKQIGRWHGRGRLRYALTPRFGIACSRPMLQMASEVLAIDPSLYLQTHLSENKDEIATTLHLFPEYRDYLELYEHYGFARPRSVFAHGVHLSASEVTRLKQAEAAVAFCPTSNLFLGSGLFPIEATRELKRGLGTDVGAGTSLSLGATAAEAYKVGQLRGEPLSPEQLLYLMTLGPAEALHMTKEIGSLATGAYADIALHKVGAAESADEALRALFRGWVLAAERQIEAVYVAGRRQTQKSPTE
ncbi:MAG: guanine deaminase [Fimbriimonadaceae bacterium]